MRHDEVFDKDYIYEFVTENDAENFFYWFRDEFDEDLRVFIINLFYQDQGTQMDADMDVVYDHLTCDGYEPFLEWFFNDYDEEARDHMLLSYVHAYDERYLDFYNEEILDRAEHADDDDYYDLIEGLG